AANPCIQTSPGPFWRGFTRDRMPDNEAERIGATIEVKPHAFDPLTMPELFEGVLARRVVAFCIDVLLIATPALFVALFILVFGIFTLGLGWFLFIGPAWSSGRSSIPRWVSAVLPPPPSACA